MSDENQIDSFDRLLGSLHGLPDVTSTKPSTIQTVSPMLGTTETFIVQTYRQMEKGDTVFLQCVGKNGTVRLSIPPSVVNTIVRQRDSLTSKVRSQIGKVSAQARKDRGELPGFMKGDWDRSKRTARKKKRRERSTGRKSKASGS